jgi:hypothetical protein
MNSLSKGDIVKITGDIHRNARYTITKIRRAEVAVLVSIDPFPCMSEERLTNVVKVSKTREQIIAKWRKRHGGGGY